MEAKKKYQIIIKDLEDGTEKVNSETDAIFAVFDTGLSVRSTLATACNGNILANLLATAQRCVLEQIRNLPPEMQSLVAFASIVELGKFREEINTTEKKSDETP